jgi:hypothetical protein
MAPKRKRSPARARSRSRSPEKKRAKSPRKQKAKPKTPPRREAPRPRREAPRPRREAPRPRHGTREERKQAMKDVLDSIPADLRNIMEGYSNDCETVTDLGKLCWKGSRHFKQNCTSYCAEEQNCSASLLHVLNQIPTKVKFTVPGDSKNVKDASMNSIHLKFKDGETKVHIIKLIENNKRKPDKWHVTWAGIDIPSDSKAMAYFCGQVHEKQPFGPHPLFEFSFVFKEEAESIDLRPGTKVNFINLPSSLSNYLKKTNGVRWIAEANYEFPL